MTGNEMILSKIFQQHNSYQYRLKFSNEIYIHIILGGFNSNIDLVDIFPRVYFFKILDRGFSHDYNPKELLSKFGIDFSEFEYDIFYSNVPRSSLKMAINILQARRDGLEFGEMYDIE